MLLSEIVKRVNAKSFGETDYDYDDIYPYFQEAIDSLNSQLDVHRRVADAPRVYTEDAEYNFLLDIYINNYIVTYIAVAMDNASLSVTSRTQTYAAQLEQHRSQTISDLYKWMPVKSTGTSMVFDLTGYAGAKTLDVPQVKAWYDESIGGELSGYGSPIPTKGVRWDNPYGTLVVHPKYADYKMKLGSNLVPYVFIPNEYFRQYYKNTIAWVSFYGYNIDVPVKAELNNVYDIGNRTGLDALLLAAWTVLKDDYGRPIANGPSVVTGTCTDGQGTESVMILQHESGLRFYDIDTGEYYLATPVDLNSTPVKFNKTEVISSVDLRLQEMQNEINAYKTEVGNTIAEYKTEVGNQLAEQNSVILDYKTELNYNISQIKDGVIPVGKAIADGEGRKISDTYVLNGTLNTMDNELRNGTFKVGYADKTDNDGEGNNIVDTYATKTEVADNASITYVDDQLRTQVLNKIGNSNGIAQLDEAGKVPSSQLPSYVDDVLEFIDITDLPVQGAAGKIYVTTMNNKTYRWSGTGYVEISPSLTLGETSSTAYAGDKGKKNADDIVELQNTKANKTDIKTYTAGTGITIAEDGTISSEVDFTIATEEEISSLFGYTVTIIEKDIYDSVIESLGMNLADLYYCSTDNGASWYKIFDVFVEDQNGNFILKGVEQIKFRIYNTLHATVFLSSQSLNLTLEIGTESSGYVDSNNYILNSDVQDLKLYYATGGSND